MTHCIHCNKELKDVRIDDHACFCTNPSCPLKGLLQVGRENMPEVKEVKTMCEFHGTQAGNVCLICPSIKYQPITQPKRWKPENREEYWYIDFYQLTIEFTHNVTSRDAERINIGNCWKTEAEAELMRDKIKNLLIK